MGISPQTLAMANKYTDDKNKNIDSQLADIAIKRVSDIYDYNTKWVAHRGLWMVAPENSTKAIVEAVRYGYAMVELDLKKTKDGIFILMHDYTVDRTTDGVGRVDEMTLQQIKELTLTDDFRGKDGDVIRIPTFEEACRICNKYRIGINIDMQSLTFLNDDIVTIVEMLKVYNIYYNSVFCCTDADKRNRLTTLYPDANVFWLDLPTDKQQAIEQLSKHKNSIAGVRATNLTDDLIQFYNVNSIPIYLFAVTNQRQTEIFRNKVKYIETDITLPLKEVF